MSAKAIARIEKTRGQKLSEADATRLRSIGEALNLRDDDALWDVLAAVEYQRAFYEALPDKITAKSAELMQDMAVAAEKETAAAEAKLADSVVKQAHRLAGKINYGRVIPTIALALLSQMIMGSLLLWAGYNIGTGLGKPPEWLLWMPAGILMGGLSLGVGIFLLGMAGREYANGDSWWKLGAVALAFMAPGAAVLAYSV